MGIYYHYWNVSGFQSFDNSTLPMLDVVRSTNEQMSGVPAFVIIASVFLVTFIALKTRGHSTKTAMASTSTIIAVLALVLEGLGMIHPTLFWISLILPGVTTFLLFVLD